MQWKESLGLNLVVSGVLADPHPLTYIHTETRAIRGVGVDGVGMGLCFRSWSWSHAKCSMSACVVEGLLNLESSNQEYEK